MPCQCCGQAARVLGDRYLQGSSVKLQQLASEPLACCIEALIVAQLIIVLFWAVTWPPHSKLQT